MISRRLLRIKVLQAIYAFHKRGMDSLSVSEKELFHSIDKTYELYHLLFRLIPDIGLLAEKKMDLSRNKKIPSFEDLHPNTKFIDNLVVQQIRNNLALKKFIEKTGISWVRYPELVRSLYRELLSSPYYQQYMNSGTRSYEEDKGLVIQFLSNNVTISEELSQSLEEQSIYWNDELEFVVGMMIRTIRKFRESEGGRAKLMDKYKNEDDIEFTKQLFRKTLANHTRYREIIEKYSENWEIDRIAFLDILIMEMAICELLEFSQVPVKVTMNEYIEIAKFYSTDKSGIFVNGILDKTIQYFREEKMLLKRGRGLIGE